MSFLVAAFGPYTAQIHRDLEAQANRQWFRVVRFGPARVDVRSPKGWEHSIRVHADVVDGGNGHRVECSVDTRVNAFSLVLDRIVQAEATRGTNEHANDVAIRRRADRAIWNGPILGFCPGVRAAWTFPVEYGEAREAQTEVARRKMDWADVEIVDVEVARRDNVARTGARGAA